MRRSNEKCKVSGYNAGRGITSQTLLYQHMSNHYRRILNAKKSIDTAPPTAYKKKVTSSTSSPVRSCSGVNGKFVGGNISPALTDRSASTYSNGDIYYASDAYYPRKCQNSRSNECNCGTGLQINPNSSEMELINHIAFDTKLGPANYFDSDWKNLEGGGNLKKSRSPYEAKKIGNRNNNSDKTNKTGSRNKCKFPCAKRKLPVKDKPPSDLMEKHSKCFISHNNSFCPRILNTNATSKVKNLKVYHPPRRKRESSQLKEEVEETKTSANPINMTSKSSVATSNQKNKNGKCKQPEASQTSSRDSAYNGGVSSLPESRSPTPDQRTKNNCGCHGKERSSYYENVRRSGENIVVPNLKLTDCQDTQTEINGNESCESKASATEESRSVDFCDVISRSKKINFRDEKNASIKSCSSNDDEKDTFKRKIKEETMYTNFIRDITAEVLEKGLYTNKALKNVMRRHMILNLWHLDKDRMVKEIDKLRIQLGIPQDEDLLDIRVDALESFGAFKECHPVISDSELMGQSFRRSREHKTKGSSYAADGFTNRTRSANPDVRFPKSISEVLSQSCGNYEMSYETESDEDEDDDELISVIHVSKLIRDKKKRDSYVCDLSSDPSRNATQGNSADESEQSSDHLNRKKKPLTRHRTTEASKTSSSSDDPETNQLSIEMRRHYTCKTDNGAESSNTGKTITTKTESDELKSDDDEIDSATE